nr:protein kinase-like domain-containing protein [Tanacetum cinerariifolium]
MSSGKLSSPVPLFLVVLDKWVSLEFLNLSFNDFEGEVPIGVFANASKFSVLGNDRLCGGLVTLADVATALDYLHNHCQTTIVHGDLKPSNILLDSDMVAHVGDFGLARLLGTDLNLNSSTGVKGTIEYGVGSEMTSSGDVYSFGILLLEVMTGKKPTDGMFNEGLSLSLHKFAYMALPDHLVTPLFFLFFPSPSYYFPAFKKIVLAIFLSCDHHT